MTHSESIAVLADIHGNSFALKAVLKDIQKRGLDRLVNLGDIFYGPLDPAGTWKILKTKSIPTVIGNQDRILLEGGPGLDGVPTFTRTLDAIGQDGLGWLQTLPATHRMYDILLCHGTPQDDMSYLLEDVSTGVPVMRDCTEISMDIVPGAEGCSLVLAGHSHFPGQIECRGVTIVNPGSVGLPAYDDDTPPHVMACGSPHARYAIVTRTSTGWECEFVQVKYDWKSAAELAMENGRNDWAQWLSTGQG